MKAQEEIKHTLYDNDPLILTESIDNKTPYEICDTIERLWEEDIRARPFGWLYLLVRTVINFLYLRIRGYVEYEIHWVDGDYVTYKRVNKDGSGSVVNLPKERVHKCLN